MAEELKAPEGEKKPEGANNVGLDLNTCTVDEFTEKLDKDPRFRDEYLLNSNDSRYSRVNELYGAKISGVPVPEKPAESAQPDQGDNNGEGANAAQSQTTENGEQSQEEIIEIKIPKSLLGTYLTNRTGPDAVVEALKGKQHADQFIEQLKTRNDGLASETLNLRRQLLEMMQKKSQLEVSAPASSPHEKTDTDVETVDFDANKDLLDPDSLFDPENQKRVIDLISKAKTQIERLSKPAQPQKAEPPSQPGKRSEDVEAEIERLHQSVIDREFDEITQLQMEVPELRTARLFRQVDLDVDTFHRGVRDILGVNGKISQYFAQTPEGDRLRQLCTARGIKPPDEYDTWSKIIGLRKDRNSNIEKLRQSNSKLIGREMQLYEVPEIPNNTYLDHYRRNATIPASGDSAEIRRMEADARRRAEEQAAAEVVARKTAPDPTVAGRTASAEGIATGTGLSEAEIIAIFSKPVDSMTSEEAKMCLSICNQRGWQPFNGLLERARS